VKILVRLKGADPTAARVMAGSFEHHMNLDHSGYPKLPTPRQQSLFGRIISIADCYDAMTSSRVYNRTAIAPERALRFMLNKAGSAFDPVLMKVFVNTIGIFPVGSLLLLTSGELALVVGAHEDPTLANRPPVRLITGTDGTALTDLIDVPLDEVGDDGAFARDIDRVVDAQQYGIDTSHYFL
jgi:HD-GYP domain-containing protein (c-di-GMP phosphodiesterase class II)